MSESEGRSEAGLRAVRLLSALDRYRADLRARDGGRNSTRDGTACLLERSDEISQKSGRERRRLELVEGAVSHSRMPRDLAEEAYDLAREEGLEPAFGLEIARCGIAVCEVPDQEVEPASVVGVSPEWLDEPVPEGEADRERRLRLSFRRLRRLLEESGTPEEALRTYAAEPDVRECGF